MLERPYFYCSRCKQGFHPLDQALELARGVHQYDIQENALAAELMGDLVGLSNHVAHDTAGAISALADQATVIPDATEIQRRIDAAKPHPNDKPVLVMALDGAHEPTRPQAKRDEKRGPGQWKETKDVRLHLALADNRIEQLASWQQIQDAEAMRRDLEQIAQRIPQDQARIALLGDGAAWVWNTLTAVFPAGRSILDVFHCKAHLYQVADTPKWTLKGPITKDPAPPPPDRLKTKPVEQPQFWVDRQGLAGSAGLTLDPEFDLGRAGWI